MIRKLKFLRLKKQVKRVNVKCEKKDMIIIKKKKKKTMYKFETEILLFSFDNKKNKLKKRQRA